MIEIKNIKNMLIACVLKRQKHFNITLRKSTLMVACELYGYSTADHVIESEKDNYIHKIFEFITDDIFSFSDSELTTIRSYLKNAPVISDDQIQSAAVQIKKEVAEQNAYKDYLAKNVSKKYQIIYVFLSYIQRKATSKNCSLLDSLNDSILVLYKFSQSHRFTASCQSDYKNRFLELITANNFNFSDRELKAIKWYLKDTCLLPNDKIIEISKTIKAEIAEQEEYKQKLLESTEEQRTLLRHSRIIFSDEIINYVKYWETFEQRNGDYLLYNNLYFLGYISGKRSERARRKKHSCSDS